MAALPTSTTTLAELEDWSIELRCGCRVVFMPCKLLARDHGGHHQVPRPDGAWWDI
ncbi:hypothetical protein [Falsiroseomonas sp. HW251]|uniref:hypothetical protein n=1 Tax=Falsiroseomonas sp. HW251 TaxID=3390998 RepID=UPI003D317A16